MANLDKAMARLETALGSLEGAMSTVESEGAPCASDDERVVALETERKRLADEVSRLQEAAAEDAKLRAEAADAVKVALSDLRQIVPMREMSDG